MSTDDPADDGEGTDSPDENPDGGDVRDRLEEEADKAVEQFDEGIVDLLSWVLETETRARIYVYLREHPESTSDEIADGTGLYPSTVREALAELHDEGKVSRHKRESDGAGNNPYEYAAMAPSELVGNIVDDVQDQLNTVFNLDDALDVDAPPTHSTDEDPVTITVEDASDAEDDEDGDEGEADGADDEADEDSAADGDPAADGDEDAADDTDGDE
jgi:predicted transcriptional regulator